MSATAGAAESAGAAGCSTEDESGALDGETGTLEDEATELDETATLDEDCTTEELDTSWAASFSASNSAKRSRG